MRPGRYLFVGGSNDGSWRQVDGDRELIALPKRERMALDPALLDAASSATMKQVSIEEYRREIFREGERDFILFVHTSVRTGSVFQRLLNGYRAEGN